MIIHRGVEQLVARLPHKQEVVGSSPTRPTEENLKLRVRVKRINAIVDYSNVFSRRTITLKHSQHIGSFQVKQAADKVRN